MNVLTSITFKGRCAQALDFYRTVFPDLEAEVQTFGMCREELGPLVNGENEDLIFRAQVRTGSSQFLMGDSPALLFRSREEWEGGVSDNLIFEVRADSEEQARSIYDKLIAKGKSNAALGPKPGYALYGSLIDQYGLCWNIIWRG